ncbi:GGDEF domain-containing protein [Paenibacillus woosongensis]|uniref:Diguanylate cyclase n=1 Tax=Paenibacillus woosongensis TaxID=307580 RepID=A0A7X2Z261_9BACL|nr:GGDEF domain-containing protein [Paenibacillus woosongensis]MUG45683.1 diguanylate cyclase [Paenibacillus woosongensis]
MAEHAGTMYIIIIGVLSAVLVGMTIVLRSLLRERADLMKLAYTDAVTGLMNRNGFDHFWTRHKGKDHLAVLSLDLDHFKEINDTYGHMAGDQLLHDVSIGLRQITNKNQLAFRIGGDEFVFIMKNCDPNKVEILAALILDKISRPFEIQGRNIKVTGSIGISISEGRKVDRLRMMAEADLAMYHAKKLGRNRYSLYREERHKYLKELEYTLRKKHKRKMLY